MTHSSSSELIHGTHTYELELELLDDEEGGGGGGGGGTSVHPNTSTTISPLLSRILLSD